MNNNKKKLTFDDVADMIRKFIQLRPSIIRLMIENTNLIRGNQSIEWRIDPVKSTNPSTVLILNNFDNYFRIVIGYKYHLFDIYPDKVEIKMNYNEIIEFKNDTKFDNVYKQLPDDLYYSLSTDLELFDNSLISDTSLKSTIHDLIKEYEYAHRDNFRIDCRYVSNLNNHETIWKFSTPAKSMFQLALKFKDASTDTVNRKEIWFDNVLCIVIKPDEYSSEIYVDYALLSKNRGEYTTHKDLIPYINTGLRKWFHNMRLEQDDDLQNYLDKISMETLKILDEAEKDEDDNEDDDEDSDTANVVKSAQDIVNNYPEHEEQKFSMEDMVNFSVEVMKAYLPSASEDFVERFVNQVKGVIIMKNGRETNNENDREI